MATLFVPTLHDLAASRLGRMLDAAASADRIISRADRLS